MSDRIGRAFKRSGATRAVALDISKAFNRVWLAGLLHKLKSYGISGWIFGLISSFLSNRWLRVVVNEKSSQESFHSKCNQASDLWQQLELASELESDLRDTVDWGRKWLVDFNAGKTQLVSFDRSKNTGVVDVKMDGSVLEGKSSFMMMGLTFSSKLDWGSYIISIAKTASKKIGALICSMKFLSPEFALCLYKSTIHPWMEYCCHV